MSPAESPPSSGVTVGERTVGAALAHARDTLQGAGSPSARLDAEVLVAWSMERERSWLLAHLDDQLPAEAATVLSSLVTRRAMGEPVAYIRGFKEWYGLRIATDDRALIPRPETELLVDAAVADIAERMVSDDEPIEVREVGTGSGAVSVALARRFRAALTLGRLRLVASDVSADALELAADNLAAHGLAHLVTLAVADLLDPVASLPQADVVVANLPYVRSAEVATGHGSLAWEPALALDGGADGLDLVRRLLSRFPDRLAGHGSALLEIGADQAEPVVAEVAGLPGTWSAVTTRDLAGHERIIRLARDR
ncbi:MAG TPA: peptide chain release factor N(5)-glutamine methyltransferase [Candidatus Limnocylindria bacterium]|jgi:release factor glutamine methyltransferase|nr:peptide chain release factor N(5)-glutamine methyltransferase [Candidatus Limnocylindria bacterium]